MHLRLRISRIYLTPVAAVCRVFVFCKQDHFATSSWGPALQFGCRKGWDHFPCLQVALRPVTTLDLMPSMCLSLPSYSSRGVGAPSGLGSPSQRSVLRAVPYPGCSSSGGWEQSWAWRRLIHALGIRLSMLLLGLLSNPRTMVLYLPWPQSCLEPCNKVISQHGNKFPIPPSSWSISLSCAVFGSWCIIGKGLIGLLTTGYIEWDIVFAWVLTFYFLRLWICLIRSIQMEITYIF